jgi:uncharacterized protein YigE (DUF2233 family)
VCLGAAGLFCVHEIYFIYCAGMLMKTLLMLVGLTMLGFLQAAIAVECSSAAVFDKRFTVCRVDVRKEKLQLLHYDDSGQPFKRYSRLISWLHARDQTLVFAMNAGMYHSDFSAVGLFVANGAQHVALNTAKGEGNFFLKPNGVFAITDVGARVIESSEYPLLREPIILATQSGPLLVHNGKIHPVFKADSKSRLIRNGVGVAEPGVAIFVISEQPVNFYEFATVFRDSLHCLDALYLDGTISSLYSAGLNRHDERMDLGPILALMQ